MASATSLALAGAQHVDREGMLVALVDAQLEVAERWRDSGGDARGSGLADEVAAVCSTIGTVVRVEPARRRSVERSGGAARRRRRAAWSSTTRAPSTACSRVTYTTSATAG